MRLVDVEIANFLSFGPAQTVPLANLGLAALVGRNRDSGGATSNGAGKSTLPESIYWCLFGDTLRGLKGDEVVHLKSGKDCRVTLRVEDGGHAYRITRTRATKGAKRPNDLTVEIDGKPADEGTGGINADTQTLVDTIVGMDKKTFAQVVLLSHGARPISELTDSEQKRVLDDIMQNDVLARAKEIASLKVRAGQNTLAALDGELREAANVELSALQRLQKYTADAADQDRQARVARTRLLIRKSSIEGEIEKLCAGGLGAALASEADAAAAALKAHRIVEGATNKMSSLSQSAVAPRSGLQRQRGSIEGAARVRESSSKTVIGLAGKACPTCHQFVDPNGADQVTGEWEAQAKRDRAELASIDQQLANLELEVRTKYEMLEQERAAARRELDSALDAQERARSRVQELSGALQRVSMLEQQVLSVEEEIRRVDDDVGVYEKLMADAKLELSTAERRLARLKQRRKLIDMQVRYLLFWEHGFGNGGLKSYMLDGVIPYLNERAQRYADIMSGGDLKVWFTAQKELKKGGNKEEFQIHVVNRHGSDIYKGNSDGEKRRSNYAVSWAFADLAAQRAGKPIRFKMLDETFENMDEAGEEAVMRLLYDTMATHETIICVTHSERLQTQFNNIITVVKEGGNTRVE